MKVVIIGLICIVWVQKASSAPKWTCPTPGPSDDDSDLITDNGLMVNHHDDGYGTTMDTDFFDNGTYNRPPKDPFKIADNGPGDFNPGTAPGNNFRPLTDPFKIEDNGTGDFKPCGITTGKNFGPRSNTEFRKPHPDPGESPDFNNCHTRIDYDQEFGASPTIEPKWNIFSKFMKFTLQVMFFSGMVMNLYTIWKKLANNPPPRGFWKTLLKIVPAKLTGHQPNETDEGEKAMKNFEGIIEHLLTEDKFKFSFSATSSTDFVLSVSVYPLANKKIPSPSFLNPDDNKKKEESRINLSPASTQQHKEGSQISKPSWLEFCPFVDQIDWEQTEPYLEKISPLFEHMDFEVIPNLEQFDNQKAIDSESKFSPVLTSATPYATTPECHRFLLEPWPPVEKTALIEDTETEAKSPNGQPSTEKASSPIAIKIAGNHCFLESPEFPLVPWHEAKISCVEPAWTLAPIPEKIPQVLLKFDPKWNFPGKKEEQKPFDDRQPLKSDLKKFVETYKDWTPKWTEPNTTEREGEALNDVPTWKSDLLEFTVKYKNWTPTWTGGPNKKEKKLLDKVDDIPVWKSELREFVKNYKGWAPNWTGPNVVTTEDPQPPVERLSWKSDMREFVDKYKGWTPVWIEPNARKKDKKPLGEPAWKSELKKHVEKYKSENVREPRLPKKKKKRVSFAEDVTVQKVLFRRAYPFVPKILSKKMKIKIVTDTVPLKGDALEKPFKDIKLTNNILSILLF